MSQVFAIREHRRRSTRRDATVSPAPLRPKLQRAHNRTGNATGCKKLQSAIKMLMKHRESAEPPCRESRPPRRLRKDSAVMILPYRLLLGLGPVAMDFSVSFWRDAFGTSVCNAARPPGESSRSTAVEDPVLAER
ncbi:hypothetical protein J6590_070384 [Homalodisca vitripennis]|nr:hypothetical protein J6590_070384 [Homalodisca vitripennis]